MYRQVLSRRPVLLYLTAGGISRLGSILSGMGFLFLAHELTASAWHTTAVVIAETVPYLLFGLIGGVAADWVRKKTLLIALDLMRAPLATSVFLLHLAGMLTYPWLLAVAFLIQTLGCFYNPGHRAVLPLLTAPEERTCANGLADTVSRGMMAISPLLAVPLLPFAGGTLFFLIDAGTFLVSAALLALIPLPEQPEPQEPRRIRHVFLAIGDYLAWVRRQSVHRHLFAASFLTVFFSTWVWEVGLLLLLKSSWEDGESRYSMLLGMFGAVVILANLVIPLVWSRLSLATYLLGAMIWGCGIGLLTWSAMVPLSWAGVIIVGVGMPLASLSRVFLLQTLTPEAKLGRGFSFHGMLLYLANVLSLATGGWLSQLVPLPWLFAVSGAAMVLTAAGYLYRLRNSPGAMRYNLLNNRL